MSTKTVGFPKQMLEQQNPRGFATRGPVKRIIDMIDAAMDQVILAHESTPGSGAQLSAAETVTQIKVKAGEEFMTVLNIIGDLDRISGTMAAYSGVLHSFLQASMSVMDQVPTGPEAVSAAHSVAISDTIQSIRNSLPNDGTGAKQLSSVMEENLRHIEIAKRWEKALELLTKKDDILNQLSSVHVVENPEEEIIDRPMIASGLVDALKTDFRLVFEMMRRAEVCRDATQYAKFGKERARLKKREEVKAAQIKLEREKEKARQERRSYNLKKSRGGATIGDAVGHQLKT